MNQRNAYQDIQDIDDAAARREAEIIGELDAQRALWNSSNAPLIGLAVVTALTLPLLLLATMKGGPAMAVAPHIAAPAVAGAMPTYVNWNYSFESAQQQAAASNKIMLVEFYTDWCGVCKQMDATTYNDPAIIAESQNVVPVKINAEGRTDLAQRYGINCYPTYVWMDSAGNERYRVSGGYSAYEFLPMMQQNR